MEITAALCLLEQSIVRIRDGLIDISIVVECIATVKCLRSYLVQQASIAGTRSTSAAFSPALDSWWLVSTFGILGLDRLADSLLPCCDPSPHHITVRSGRKLVDPLSGQIVVLLGLSLLAEDLIRMA